MMSDAGSTADAEMIFQPSTRSAPARAYHRKWQSAFDAAEDEEIAKKPDVVRASMAERMRRGWKLQSIPGFLFGPLYYFYLRMWRKGLLMIGLLPIVGLTQTIVGGAKFLDLLIPVVCMTFVKRDYYKFCIQGEAVWPWARISKNIWADAALVTATLVICKAGVTALSQNKHESSIVTEYGPYHRAGIWQLKDDLLSDGVCNREKTYRLFESGLEQTCVSKDTCLEPSRTERTMVNQQLGQYSYYLEWDNDPKAIIIFETPNSDDRVTSTASVIDEDAFFNYYKRYGRGASDAREKMRDIIKPKTFEHCR